MTATQIGHSANIIIKWNFDNMNNTILTSTRNYFFLITILLSGCSTGYVVNIDKVEFEHWNTGHGQQSFEVVGADAKTFEVLPAYYAKDNNHVWYRGMFIKGVDTASFETLARGYAKDRNHAYLNGELIEGAKGASFKVLKRYYAIDDTHLFLRVGIQKPIKPCDIESIRVIDVKGLRALDDKCYYIGLKIVPIKDRATLKILPHLYAVDRYNVYHGDKIFKGADPSTFTMIGYKIEGVVDSYYPRDKNGCYKQHKLVSCDVYEKK